MCRQSREILNAKLQQMAQGVGHIFEDKQGRLTLSVHAGEGLYLFTCREVPTTLRSSTQCCQELPVTAGGQDLFIKPLTRRLTTHCTATLDSRDPPSCTSPSKIHPREGVHQSRHPQHKGQRPVYRRAAFQHDYSSTKTGCHLTSISPPGSYCSLPCQHVGDYL